MRPASTSNCIRAPLKVRRLDSLKSPLRREASFPIASKSPSWWTCSVLKAEAVVATSCGLNFWILCIIITAAAAIKFGFKTPKEANAHTVLLISCAYLLTYLLTYLLVNII